MLTCAQTETQTHDVNKQHTQVMHKPKPRAPREPIKNFRVFTVKEAPPVVEEPLVPEGGKGKAPAKAPAKVCVCLLLCACICVCC